MDACRGADLVTTDVWTSMGFEAENDARQRDFADWMVDAEMMRQAKPDALFMHCLPAHRGEEVTAEVIDGPQSVGLGRGGEPAARAEGAARIPRLRPRQPADRHREISVDQPAVRHAGASAAKSRTPGALRDDHRNSAMEHVARSPPAAAAAAA